MENRVPGTQKTAERPEFFYDISSQKMLVGRVALMSAFENGVHPSDCKSLGELLIDKSLTIRRPVNNPHEYLIWRKEDYRAYGKWLIDVLKPYNEDLDIFILRNAYRLGIGPGESVGSMRNYGSLQAFFDDVGRQIKPRGRFNAWQDSEWIIWANSVAQENNGEFSEKILTDRQALDDIDEPSIKIIKTRWRSIRSLKYAAGLKVYNEPQPPERCLAAGVVFFEINGRLPKKDDFAESTLLPSESPIYKHFGDLAEFRRILAKMIDDIEYEKEYAEDNFPPGFLEQIEELEARLSNPPSQPEMLQQLRQVGWFSESETDK